MWTYLAKRLLLMTGTLFGICILSFVIITQAPGDPAAMVAGVSMGARGAKGRSTDQVLMHTRRALYLDRPKILNTDPATRSKVARDLARKVCEGTDYVRDDASKEIAGGIGTAGLGEILEELSKAAERRSAEAAKLAADAKGLAELAKATPTDGVAIEARIAALEKLFPGRGPRFLKKEGPQARGEAWADWLKQRQDDPVVGVNLLLDTLDQLVPASQGGPAPKGALLARVAAWTEWWPKNRDRFSPEAAAKVVAAYMSAPEGDKAKGLDEVVRLGGAATGAAMEAYLGASSDDARRRAALAVSLVAHKPWDLAVKPTDLEKLGRDWAQRKAELEDASAKKQMADDVLARRLAALGDRDTYVAREVAKEIKDQKASIARWWFRSEEEFVEFGALRQLGRAFTQTQFGNWGRGLLFGLDFGKSFMHKGKDVSTLILERLPITLELNAISLFLTYLVAVPLGVFSATKPRSTGDRIATFSLFILYSLPSFWMGGILILFFTGPPIGVSWFPSYGIESPDAWKLGTGAALWDHLLHIALPVFCLTYGGIAYISRQMRAGMLETIRLDYIRTARAKGLSEKVVIYKHALRNSLIPVVTILAYLLPNMFGGSVIIEQIFSIDGLGRLMFEAILARDLPVIMAEVFISGLLTLMGMLLADITYALVDPRIELK